MKEYVELFAPQVKAAGFFNIWSKHVKAKQSPETIVNLFLEHLRSESSAKREAFCVMLSFMQVNKFPELLKGIFDYITNEELDDFGTAGIGAFYEQMVKLITLQVEEYWTAFYASQQEKSKQMMEDPDALLRTKVRTILGEILPEKLKETLEKLGEDDDRKSGEDWKKGS